MMRNPSLESHYPINVFARLFFMLVLLVLFTLVRWMTWLVVIYQLIHHIFTGRASRMAVGWGEALSGWIHRMLLFMTYKTERMPFPFHTLWPDKE
ncbi:MAG: DUF4389 domain-containing protein [Methylococcaceae bacterium]|nr:DUF4389 domain-containing protein [Methylococcaceae bacterium]